MNTFGTKGSYRVEGLSEERLRSLGYQPTDKTSFCRCYINRKEESPVFWAPRKKAFYTLETDYTTSTIYGWRRYWEKTGYYDEDDILTRYPCTKMI